MQIERVAIDTLTEDPANLRLHGPRNLEAIAGSIKRFGQQKPIVVDGNNIVVAGNGTLEAAKKLGWTEIDIVKTPLTGTDATAYAIADNRTAELAEWDDAELAVMLDTLKAEDASLLAAVGYTTPELEQMLREHVLIPEDDDTYTGKAQSPAYEIVGDKPKLDELFDTTYADSLIEEIEASDVDESEKKFLIAAAYRHVVFNFEKVAEWYAHSDETVQGMFEDSALVIVDMDKAIEKGWTKFSESLNEIFEDEKGHA